MIIGGDKLVFKIDGDSRPLQREINALHGRVNSLGGSFTGAFGGAIPVASAVAGAVAAVGTAAIAAGAAIFNLTKEAADYGSAIFDASMKTGLSAETLTSLKFAAEQNGTEFEKMTKGVTVFGIMIGQAAQGSTVAAKTLEDLKVTSTDLETALGQVFKTINEGKTDTDKLALATAAFGKKIGPDLIPLIKDADGDLNKLKETARRLGVTLTDEDVRAADEFGDTLDLLKAQAGGLGRQFASELMPMMTGAMKDISHFMIVNQGTAREWGQDLTTIAQGVGVAYEGLAATLNFSLDVISYGLAANLRQTSAWALGVGALIRAAMGPIGVLLTLGEAFGEKSGRAGLGGSVNIPTQMPGLSRGGGKGGGGGAAKTGPSEFETAQKEMQRRMGLYRADLKLKEEHLAASLTMRLVKEDAYAKAVNDLKIASAMLELELNKSLVATVKMTAEQRIDIQQKILIGEKEVAAAQVKLGHDVFKANQEITAKEKKDFEDWQEREKKRRDEMRKTANLRAKTEISDSEKEHKKRLSDMNLSILGDSPLSIRNEFGNLEGMISPVLPMLQLAGQAIHQLAEGIGALVNEWVLMGSVGPNAMRKMVASVLAGVSAQAAVLAVMELAYGIAALTPWGFAIYGSPAAHFKAAALFGSIALVAGVAGRAVAGDSFKNDAGESTSTGPGRAERSTDPFSRTSQNAFISGRQSHDQMVATAIDKLTAKIEGMRPGDVLARAAQQRPGLIAQEAVNGAKRNAGIGRQMASAIGMK